MVVGVDGNKNLNNLLMNKIKISNYTFHFPSDLKIETFETPGSNYGVNFKTSQYRYEIIYCALGLRLLVNSSDPTNFLCRDLPLNDNTVGLLPDCIKVIKNE